MLLQSKDVMTVTYVHPQSCRTVFLNISGTVDPLSKIILHILIKQNIYQLKYRFFGMFLLQCGSKKCDGNELKACRETA
jgi:hypothetical protein